MARVVAGLLLVWASGLEAQSFEKFFPAKDLTTVGVYYYPEHWDPSQWDRDFASMAALGFEFTHFAEFAWAQLEPEEGRYDFAWLDRAIELAARHKLKVILCTSTATPPVWLVRKHPEVLATDETGVRMDHGSRQHATFSSNYYRQYSLKLIEQLARRYGNDARVIGWQLDNEPRRFLDYGQDAPGRFRAWLQAKYGTIDALNKAWGNAFWSGTYSDFAQVNLPLHSQWGMNLHQRLDHYRFADDETATFLDEQAGVIRKFVTANQWVTSNYIPMYDVGYIGASRLLDFEAYTRYMVYGEHRGIGPRGYRVGEYTRIAMANDFFRPLKGMYGVMELQPGQVNWGTINPQPLPGAVRLWLWHVFAGGSRFTCTYRYRAPLYGFEAYHYGIVGTDGVTPTVGGREYAQFIDEIRQLRQKAVPAAPVPAPYAQRRTGILVNTDNIQAIALNPQTTEWQTEAHILKYYRALKSFGAPVDFVRDSADFTRYPVLVVPAYQMIDEAMIARLRQYAEQGGALVLTTRTGLQNRLGHLWDAKFYQPMWPLIGAEVDSYDLPMPHAPNQVEMAGVHYDWSSWGDLLAPKAGTATWATHAGDFYAGIAAVVSRKLGRGTVTWVGVDTRTGELEKQVLARVFGEHGIATERYPEGIIVEYRDGLGIAVNYADQPYRMALPPGTEILIGDSSIGTAGVLVWKADK
ncbi:MAG: beta-galactosidase [Chloroflexi bacterium]|nr:beta-galactosidase [Chloroflexota bacterium]